MAEDFPHYHNEDSDDDTPAESRAASRHEVHPPEQPAPTGQEGLIFSRDLAPTLSRPLFEFIRKQEQPVEAKRAAEEAVGTEALPSVSVPDNPEVRTYQPPVEAEVVQAQHELSQGDTYESDEDDDTDEDEQSASAGTAVQHTQQPDLQRPLNKQFEEIMRENMGEDFARLTSGTELQEPSTAEAEDETEEPRAAAVPVAPTQPLRSHPGGPDWLPPIPPTPLEDAPGSDTNGPPLQSARPMAFAPPPVTQRVANYNVAPPPPVTNTGNIVPPIGPNGGGGGGGGGNGGNFNAGPPMGGNAFGNIAPIVPNLVPAAANVLTGQTRPERRGSHNGLWFVAGVLTGWVVKQHLANKKLTRFQEAAQKREQQQNERYNQLAVEHQDLRRGAQRSEEQFLQAQQENKARLAAQPTAAEQAGVAPSAAQMAEQATVMPGQAQEAAAAPAARQATEQRVQPLSASYETPLQHPGAAETTTSAPFAAAEGVLAGGAATRTAEAPAQPEQKPGAAPAAETAAAQELVEQAYKLQSGQHVEQAAGGRHIAVVDRYGNVVQNAVEYGDEFKSQQRQEQVRESAFAGSAGSAGGTDNQAYGVVTGLGARGIESGLANAGHQLTSGQAPGANQRLLPSKHHNPLVATLASPWLWAALIVLLLAFFVAAFI